MSKKAANIIWCVFSCAIFAGVSAVIAFLVSNSGVYPSGSDVMYHIYRGEFLYKNLCRGNLYPLFDPSWYNGVEIMRYWAPLCAFTYAGCEAVANLFQAAPFTAYLYFAGFVFFSGACIWLYIGLKEDRPLFGMLFGILWFFMPSNLYVFFGEGNLARSLAAVFLPLLAYSAYSFLNTRKIRFLVSVTASFTMIVLCHLGYAVMVLATLLVALLIDMVINLRFLDDMRIVGAAVLGIPVTGFWLVPYFMGNVQSAHGSEVMEGFFQNILISLNPLYRYESENYTYYFGLSLALLALFGIFFGYRKTFPGFLTGIIVLFLSTRTMMKIIRILPGSENFWMLRFFPIAACFILIAFFLWKQLKRSYIILFMIMLTADVIPSLPLIYNGLNGITAEQRLDIDDEEYLIKQAGAETDQRFALIDESVLESLGAYLASSWRDEHNAVFGAGLEAAETAANIFQLNRALAEGSYLYMFDRLVELGADTVVVKLSRLNEDRGITFLEGAAERLGYVCLEENEDYRLYKLSGVQKNFGVKSKYTAIGIGSGAATMSRQFPCVKETSSTNLNDYTFDELKDYKVVYISGFTYNDRDKAEQLCIDLSNAGVRIVIDADGIPEDRAAHNQSFLGVVCNSIQFSQGYPLLDTVIGELDTDLFPVEHRQWRTVYMDGLDKVWGSVRDANYSIPFFGNVKNENIVFIGLNLTYYLSITRDSGVEKLLSRALDLPSDEIPERQIIPLDVMYFDDHIRISSPEDMVNTTISYHSMFSSNSRIDEDNNLLVVNKGVTIVDYVWEGIYAGVIVTNVSLVLLAIYYMIERNAIIKGKKKEIITETT